METSSFYAEYASDARFNMAFDEWLLACALDRPSMVGLRLYTWQKPAITIGRNQRLETALDWSSLDNTPVIRRVTGGRAVYHDLSELTYSVIVNQAGLRNGKLTGTLSRSLTVIAQALAGFLHEQGIFSEYLRTSSSCHREPGFLHKAPCFAANARFELISSGRKVVASAQRRKGSVLLQHGSIKLTGVAWHPALGPASESPSSAPKSITDKAFEGLSETFCRTMGDYLGVTFEPDTLPRESLSQIETIIAQQENLLRSHTLLNKDAG